MNPELRPEQGMKAGNSNTETHELSQRLFESAQPFEKSIKQPTSGSELECVHSIVPAVSMNDGKDLVGPWKVDSIYTNGNSGDKWLAERTRDVSGKEITMIRIRQDDMTYVDFLRPNAKENAEQLLVMDPYGAHPVESGSEEEQSVLRAIHKLNFDSCKTK